MKEFIWGRMFIILPFFLFTFLFPSCNSCCGWTYQEVVSKTPSYTCGRIAHDPTQLFNGLALEFQGGCYGTLAYISVCRGCIPASEENSKYTPLIISINEQKYPFWGYLEKGCQRVKLPDEATALLIDALKNEETVSVSLMGYCSQFTPKNFPTLYLRFSQITTEQEEGNNVSPDLF